MKRFLVGLTLLSLAAATALADLPSRQKIDEAASAIRTSLTAEDAKVAPTAALLAIRGGGAPAANQQLLTRAAAGLDASDASQAVRLQLLLAAMPTTKEQVTALANKLAAHPIPTENVALGSEALIVDALAQAGKIGANPGWTNAAEKLAKATILKTDADGAVALLKPVGVRQEAYGAACCALVSLVKAGCTVDALPAMLATMQKYYAAGDGSLLAEPKGNPSVRDGRAPSGNAEAALAWLGYADVCKDDAERAAAKATAKKILEATLPKAAHEPAYAGLWYAASLCSASASGAEAGGASVPATLVIPNQLGGLDTPTVAPTAPTAGPLDASQKIATKAELAAPVKPGEDAVINLTILTDPEFHCYAHEAGNDFVVPTTVTVKLPDGFQLKGIEYPKGEATTMAGENVNVYRNGTVIKITVKTPATLPAGAAATLTTRVQACNETNCLKPTNLKATVELK